MTSAPSPELPSSLPSSAGSCDPPARSPLGVDLAGRFWPLREPLDLAIGFEVFGPPKASPRARHGKAKMRRDPSADHWQQSIRDAARAELRRLTDLGVGDPELAVIMGDGVFGLDPVQIIYDLRVPRFKSHHVANDFNRELKHDAPQWPTSRPDIDNYEKAIYDALGDWRREGCLAWHDDAQVVGVNQVTRYVLPGEAPGLLIALARPGFNPTVDPAAAFA